MSPKKRPVRYFLLWTLLALGTAAGFLGGFTVLGRYNLRRTLQLSRYALLQSLESYKHVLENARWPAQRHDQLALNTSVEAQMLQVSYGFDYDYFLLRSIEGETRVEIRKGALQNEKSKLSILGEDSFSKESSDMMLRPCEVRDVTYLCLLAFPLEKDGPLASARSYLVVVIPVLDLIAKAKYSREVETGWLPAVSISISLPTKDYPYLETSGGPQVLALSSAVDKGIEIKAGVTLSALAFCALRWAVLLFITLVPLVFGIYAYLGRRLQAKLELDLIRSRLESLDKMNRIVRGVVHDIKSPLTALKLIAGTPNDPGASNLIDHVIKRMSLIIRDLEFKAESRLEGQEHSLVPLKLAIQLAISEKQSELSGKASFDFRPGRESYWVKGSFSELLRMFSNIFNNAVEASDPVARITISLSLQNGWVSLVLKDEGKGIPPEVLESILREGVSYAKDHGTGHGLYQSIQAVRSMGGDLSLASKLGEGTEVRLRLPLCEKPSWAIDFLDLRNVRKIVVVDDEPSVPLVWEKKLKDTRIPIAVYSHPSQIPSAVLNEEEVLFLIDNTFGNEYGLGLSFLRKNRKLHSLLVTADWQWKEIQEAAAALRIPLCGKEFIRDLEVVQ